MALQNYVTPVGEPIASAARGLFMGNRGGRFHDPVTRSLGARRHASKRWICCLLAFKDRHRTVWGTGYTELFFLDEVTAFAAGHRPCFECRRADAKRFLRALDPGLAAGGVAAVDARLHAERLDGRRRRLDRADTAALPDGTVVLVGGEACAIRHGHLLPWRPAGWSAPAPLPGGEVPVVTPPLVRDAFRAGYSPLWHPSVADIF